MTKRIDGAILRFIAVIAMLCAGAIAVSAQDKHDMEERSNALKDTRKATEVLREIMGTPEKGIPNTLFKDANAIGIFPDVIKAAFIVGGRGGDGLVVKRNSDGTWGTPVFYNVGGASFGPQIGAKSTDYVMLFMNDGSIEKLLTDKLELGADVSVAAGPVGRTAGAATNLGMDGILSYSRSKGAFAGASLKGSVLSPDNDANEAFYGMKAADVMRQPGGATVSPMPKEFETLKMALASYDK